MIKAVNPCATLKPQYSHPHCPHKTSPAKVLNISFSLSLPLPKPKPKPNQHPHKNLLLKMHRPPHRKPPRRKKGIKDGETLQNRFQKGGRLFWIGWSPNVWEVRVSVAGTGYSSALEAEIQ